MSSATVPCIIGCPGCTRVLARAGDGLLEQSGDGWSLLAEVYRGDCAKQPERWVPVAGAPPVHPAVMEVAP